MKRVAIAISLPRLLVAFAVIGLIGGMVSQDSGHSSAATYSYTQHDAYGSVDYCVLSGQNTILYGWANDPEAPAGANPYVNITVGTTTKKNIPTNQAKYRDADIDAYIKQHYPNQPTSSIYGFYATFSGLVRGTSYAVSGTALNYAGSPGSDGAMIVAQNTVVAGKASFPGKKIPDSCMPAPPAPPPSSGGTSSGGGSTGGGSTGSTGSTTKSTTKTSSSSATAAVPAPGTNDDATVTPGVNSATIVVPADNATVMHLSYSVQGGPAVDSEDQAVANGSATFKLTGLNAMGTYNFQIVRANSAGTSTTSKGASFTTKGYTVSLHFEDAKKQPVSGISATIDDTAGTKATTGSGGNMTFTNLPDGFYTISFKYNGHSYTKQYNTAEAALADPNDPNSDQSLADTVNVSKLSTSNAATSSTKHGNGALTGVLIFFGLIVLAVAGWFGWRFWQRRRMTNEYASLSATGGYDAYSPPAPEPSAPAPPLPVPTGPPPAHMGQSLRDMVVESMQQHPLPPSHLSTPGASGAQVDLPQQPSPHFVPAEQAPVPPAAPQVSPSVPAAPEPQQLPNLPFKPEDDGTTLAIDHSGK